MTDPADLAGCQFGRLTVSGPSDVRIFGGRTVLCRRRCGGSISVRPGDLRKGKVKSCGCYRREQALAALQRANQPDARGCSKCPSHPKISNMTVSSMTFASTYQEMGNEKKRTGRACPQTGGAVA